MKKIIFILLCALYACTDGMYAKAAVNIVAAENMYGEVAKELAGPYVNVVNILSNPNQDPHLFTTTPSSAVSVSKADIIIYNGADYDPWMTSLLSVKGKSNRHIIVVADLINIKSGSNPHIWYKPETIPIYAKNLVDILNQIDPSHSNYYNQHLKNLNQQYQSIFEMINRLKQRFQNTPIIATEPVFNYMTDSIGLKMHAESYQKNMMNDVPPTISQIKEFENDLHQHLVRVLIYNNQVINPSTKRMLSIAQEEKIPIVGVSETMPKDITFVKWVTKQLHELEKALEKNSGLKNG